MHVVSFSMKRAHWSSTNRTRRLFAAFDLTASRFDLMYVLDDFGGEARQADVRRVLGVAPQVTNRMTKDMEARGLVTRREDASDRRHVIITMTAYGREAFLAAVRLLRGNRVADRIVARWLKNGLPPMSSFTIDENVKVKEPGPLPVEQIEAYEEICRIEASLQMVREQCGDAASLHYPWHPEE